MKYEFSDVQVARIIEALEFVRDLDADTEADLRSYDEVEADQYAESVANLGEVLRVFRKA